MMMNPKVLLDIWAPARSPWSLWVKPVLLVQILARQSFPRLEDMLPVPLPDELLPPKEEEAPHLEADANTRAEAKHLAIVLDLPGVEAVRLGMQLAERRGYRPIPLFNCCAGDNEVVPTAKLRRALAEAAPALHALTLADDAPPVFLLDWGRLPSKLGLEPGQFDNRWMVFPQDFPSANFLRSQGITGVLQVQPESGAPPQEDLAHALRRWQQGGLKMSVASEKPGGHGKTQPLFVTEPWGFRALWHRALAKIGLRRNSAGGFGAIVPQAASGAG